jgi:hypothetical protein
VAEQERDEQAPDAPVAVEKWVNRFELCVGKRSVHQVR